MLGRYCEVTGWIEGVELYHRRSGGGFRREEDSLSVDLSLTYGLATIENKLGKRKDMAVKLVHKVRL